jgi:uncharacterized protein (DUF427 family)
MKRKIEGYFDYEDGDELKMFGKVIATVKHTTGDCNYWHITIKDEIERDMFIGYDKDLTQAQIDDCINVFWNAMEVAFTFNQSIKAVAIKTLK